jgi:hypothetical protein
MEDYKTRGKRDKLLELESVEQRLKLVYEWVKTDAITYREFNSLLNVALVGWKGQ